MVFKTILTSTSQVPYLRPPEQGGKYVLDGTISWLDTLEYIKLSSKRYNYD